ncbi:uncharacterized protein JCM6883_002953 [Sporobolomyces salmoneus]|uniref:uncharacterized protein n=1 Tax=Sporobolomyces salmoneus TaxID=183962 RepID=UPI00317AC1BD
MSQAYIQASELERVLLDPSDDSSFVVIDVRSSDFVGGNIPNALNLTTDKFSTPSKTERVISQYILPRTPDLKLVIVHCMRSQTRGPYVAHQLAHSPALPEGVEVKILKGGYQGWYRTYRGRAELFENLDQSERNEWEKVVQAKEGDREEAEDSRVLRERLGRT